jgi:2,3-bisphosphoglycerate-independent phosphoglycerate mutase
MQQLLQHLIRRNSSKIILVVLDGLGGLPLEGQTELEKAHTPHMDKLARNAACGLHIPVSIGITPGSGPGHLGLFGYDPLEHQIGRGVLEALGLGMEIRNTDVAVRCNYSTNRKGIITDRRAERIPTEQSRLLTDKLQNSISRIDDCEILLAPGMEHRFAVIFRFPEPLLPDAAAINDSDPQQEGKPPLQLIAGSTAAEKIVTIARKFLHEATALLRDEDKANHILLRGFSVLPHLMSFSEAYGLDALAIANYPMYRGLSKLVGMTAPDIHGTVQDEIDFLKKHYDEYDFFFIHIKKVDSAGEDGNFEEKTRQIEEADRLLSQIIELNSDVLIITGDHSTPSQLKSHSWHPVPFLIKSPYVLGNLCNAFSERECLKGELGILRTIHLMPLALANAGRLKKFGA